jgi:hypothetical protein
MNIIMICFRVFVFSIFFVFLTDTLSSTYAASIKDGKLPCSRHEKNILALKFLIENVNSMPLNSELHGHASFQVQAPVSI